MNIFIAKTPYHLILAHAVLLKIKSKHRNYLIYSGKKTSNINNIIISDLWSDVLFFNIDINAYDIGVGNKVKSWVKTKKINKNGKLFISDDMNWRDQLLANYLNYDKKYLIEDGVGSYYKSKLSISVAIARHTIFRALFYNLNFYYGAVSQSKATKYYALTKQGFPWVKDRSKVITIDKYLKIYLNKMQINSNHSTENTDMIMLTQPLKESNIMSKKEDLNIHQKLILPFKNRINSILVKKHPREKESFFMERVNSLRAKYYNIEFTVSIDTRPAEILLFSISSNTIIVSPVSTALINLKHLRPDLSIYFTPINNDQSISSIFEDAGVEEI